MKELLNEIHELFQDNIQKKIQSEDLDEGLELKEEIQADLEKELDAEIRGELKILKIIGAVMLVVFIVIGSLIFAFRKNIMNTVSGWTHSLIEFGEQFLKEEKPTTSEEKPNSNNESNPQLGDNQSDANSPSEKFSCTKNYDATYKGSYTSGGVFLEETITVMSDGTYSFLIGDSNASLGTYSLGNGQITLYENSFVGTVSVNGLHYTVSKDCLSLSRKLRDGTTIILKKA